MLVWPVPLRSGEPPVAQAGSANFFKGYPTLPAIFSVCWEDEMKARMRGGKPKIHHRMQAHGDAPDASPAKAG